MTEQINPVKPNLCRVKKVADTSAVLRHSVHVHINQYLPPPNLLHGHDVDLGFGLVEEVSSYEI